MPSQAFNLPKMADVRPERENAGLREDFRPNSYKSVRWSVVPVPCLSRLWLKLRGKQGSGPEGIDDLLSHIWGIFSFSSVLPPSYSDSSLKAKILEDGGEGENPPYV